MHRAVVIVLVPLAMLALALSSGCGDAPSPNAAAERAEAGAKSAAPSGSNGAVDPSARKLLERARSGEALTEAEKKQVLQGLWSWPAERGAKPDVFADDQACETRIAADPAMKDAHPLQKLGLHLRCMQAKGWTKKADS